MNSTVDFSPELLRLIRYMARVGVDIQASTKRLYDAWLIANTIVDLDDLANAIDRKNKKSILSYCTRFKRRYTNLYHRTTSYSEYVGNEERNIQLIAKEIFDKTQCFSLEEGIQIFNAIQAKAEMLDG